jgi:hypothetical protein
LVLKNFMLQLFYSFVPRTQSLVCLSIVRQLQISKRGLIKFSTWVFYLQIIEFLFIKAIFLSSLVLILLFLPLLTSAQNTPSCFDSQLAGKGDLIFAFWSMSKIKGDTINPTLVNEKPINKFKVNWILRNLHRLKDFNPDKNTSVIQSREVDIEDFYQFSYRIISEEGFIEFENGDWIYLRIHSSHEEEEIGDISLAIDNWGKMYFNQGHVCGGIIHYVTHKKLKVQSVDDFIQNFKSDTDDRPWILIDDYYNNFTYEKFN